MNIEEIISNLIKTATQKALGIEITDNFIIEHPAEMSHGDFSCNIAFILSKQLGQSPKDIAFSICENIEKESINENIEKIQVAPNGFINFFLAKKYFENELQKILENEDFGKSEIHNGKKILVEHSSPNLFKPFHIGHMMNNAIGESIVRLAHFSGAKVKTMSYPSDVSFGIGKAVWAMLESKIQVENLNSIEEQMAFLGKCYVDGTQALENDADLEKRMREITKIIYDQIPSPEYDAYLLGKNLNLKYFKEMTKKLGSDFDDYIFEREAGIEGEKIVRDNIPIIFSESEGAVIYEGEKDGLHTRVFINKENYPTYEAKDLGLMSLKFSKFTDFIPDISIFVTDHEQEEYFKVVATAAGKINEDWKNKTIHRTHGRMTFKGQKMSSRLGGVMLASEVLDMLLSEVENHAKENEVEATIENQEMISVAAIKFSILRAQAGKNINFDPETSLSFVGDSGPYLQYTFVRANSISQKSENFAKTRNERISDISDLEKLLIRFPEVVETAIKDWQPHHIASYLLEIAQNFNSWYATKRILDENNTEISHDLDAVSATKTVLKNGLYLFGVKIPDKM